VAAEMIVVYPMMKKDYKHYLLTKYRKNLEKEEYERKDADFKSDFKKRNGMDFGECHSSISDLRKLSYLK